MQQASRDDTLLDNAPFAGIYNTRSTSIKTRMMPEEHITITITITRAHNNNNNNDNDNDNNKNKNKNNNNHNHNNNHNNKNNNNINNNNNNSDNNDNRNNNNVAITVTKKTIRTIFTIKWQKAPALPRSECNEDAPFASKTARNPHLIPAPAMT